MISANNFTDYLCNAGLNYFTGVPDSTLKEWLEVVSDSDNTTITHRIAANEGAAISNAVGYYLATGNIGVVYLQNSGLGNCINPLTSLADSDVYGIPLIMLMGWRGEPGGKDEPQHKKMGKITEKILTGLGVPYEILDENNYKNKINDILTLSKSEQQPCALIIRPGFFSAHDSNKEVKVRGVATMMREDAIKSVVHAIQDNNVILSTTGKTSRELYEVCEVNQRGHNNNFYNVGSMGHVSAIGLEVALQQKEKLIFILDGDGSVIMHMGTLAAIGRYHPTNLVHIVFDNEAHESTGGQPTLSKGIDIAGIMSKCNYKKVETVDNEAAINRLLSSPISGPLGIVVKIRAGSRNDLGRPTNSPKETKIRFMNWHDC